MTGINSAKVRSRLQAVVSDDAAWQRLDRNLEGGNLQVAIDISNQLFHEVELANKGLVRLAQQVNRRHWSPLLDSQGQPDA